MWFSKSIDEVLREVKVEAAAGLSEAESAQRLKAQGKNELQSKKKKTIFQLFVAQLQEWLIYILFAAVVITLFMGEYIDAVIILLVIITNAVLGVVQEVKAGKAIEALQKMTFPKTLVRRDGQVKEVNSNEIVVGDILILDAGRYVSADMRLIETANLQIEESALTGESVPANKDATQQHGEAKIALGDRINMAFMSTLVTNGRGAGVVVATGMKTEVGKIADIINTENKQKTPLEIRLDKLGKTLGLIAIGICVFIFGVALLQGRDIAEMFILSVSLAVAAIPEGLAAIVAVVLSIGVTRMSKKKAVIKKLPAVETLGSVNIICSDKTGTLTQNKMTVKTYFDLTAEIDLDRGAQNTTAEQAQMAAKAMVLSSDATHENGNSTGDPTEIALLLMADDMGLDRKKLHTNTKRIDERSFDSERKLMSTLVDENGKLTVYTKGAIANVIEHSTRVLEHGQVIALTEEHKRKYVTATEKMSDAALRTLAVAYKPVETKIAPDQMEQDLILIGLVGMMDPPRTEVKDSIAKANMAGITTVMITGDHKNTALAIARELNMAQNAHQAITGAEMDDMTDDELTRNIEKYRVFARVSPEHKVKIVRALKSHGHVVSMTGDGVNDAPSLNAADIGVAMGITGTDVAKGASDMILMDDNFATIVSAIEQGRNIYSNIKKSVIFLLTCNFGEVIAMFVTLLVGLQAPLIATQLLWINLITDSFPAIALGMDPGNADVMRQKPRKANESFFAHGAGLHIILGGFLIGALTIVAYWFGYHEHGYSPFDDTIPELTVEYARTMAFMTLVMCQLFFSLAVRSSSKSIFQIGIFTNKYLIGAIVLAVLLQLFVVSVPFMQKAFHLQMLDFGGWTIAILLGLVPLMINEIMKIFIRAKLKRNAKWDSERN